MDVTPEILEALNKACRLAPTMRGYTVREESPVISTNLAGEVVITLPDTDLMDDWIRLCRTKTSGTVSTNTQKKTVFFRP